MDHEDDDYEMAMAPGQIVQVAAAVKPPAPEEPEPQFDMLDMDQVLAFTQRRRVKVINAITKNLSEIEDPAMYSALFKGLGDMDKAVVQRKRIGIEEEVAKTADEAARDHAQLLRAIHARAMQVPLGEGPIRAVPKIAQAALPPISLVPGEVDQGTHEMTYEGFAKDIQGKA